MSMDLFTDFEEGGGITGFTGRISEAFFRDGEYGVSLVIRTTFDHPEDYPKFEDGTFTRYFSIGKGWKTDDLGNDATHESGDPKKRYNKASQVVRFVSAIGEIPGIADVLPEDASPYKASSFLGLHLEWGQKPVTKRQPNDKGEWVSVETTELLPVALAGDTATPNSNGHIDVDALNLTGEQQVALAKLASEVDSAGKFLAGLPKIDGVMSNTTFMGAVSKDTDGLIRELAGTLL